jgi:hypothetical protein
VRPYTRDFRVDANVLHVTLAGTYPKERLEKRTNIFDPLIEACRDGNCGGAVIDARELEVELDTLELFRAGMDAASLNEHGFYVAFVAREDMIDAFFRDVLNNRGALAGIFTDMDSAIYWIRERVPPADRAASS